MQKTLSQIAQIVKGEVVGDENLIITGLSGIQEAQSGDLTFIENEKYLPLVQHTKASALITPRHFECPGKSIVRTENPTLAFSALIGVFVKPELSLFKGIHPTALIGKKVDLGQNVTVGPYTVIEDHGRIGENTVISGGCYVGHHTTIGNNCLLYPHVSVREYTQIGDRVMIHSGSVIGSDGFGYTQVNGKHQKIPQIGIVLIEDDVEIGANVTIDRARINKTVIGRGTKIDNLVQIAHNVIVGEDCIIISQVGISGSVNIGKGVILAGQVGIAGHLSIGEGAIIAAKSGIHKSVPPHTQIFGYPGQPMDKARKINACIQRLPDYVKKIQELQKKIEALEKKIYSSD
ncbi:MAG: UDP-3-O-(3-hydroxymyristoyl)glucosamine N-acyltransferase [Candidatus Omnitrophota bacterium]|nr:UDP-3-O-(3-hydroxymyristoyl)glucosamine N-acyltransferase [Candidatus Omnitrophota bacterium]